MRRPMEAEVPPFALAVFLIVLILNLIAVILVLKEEYKTRQQLKGVLAYYLLQIPLASIFWLSAYNKNSDIRSVLFLGFSLLWCLTQFFLVKQFIRGIK